MTFQRIWLKLVVAALGLGGLFGGGLLLAPNQIRSYVVRQAKARDVYVTVGRVRLGWGVVTLEEVEARLERVEGAVADFQSIAIYLDLHLRPLRVEATGGKVDIRRAETVQADIEQWRERRQAGGSSASPQRPLDFVVVVDEMTIEATDGRRLSAHGSRIRRQAGELEASVASVEAARGPLAIRSTEIEVSLAPGNALKSLHVASADVVWVEVATSEQGLPPPPTEPAVPPPVEPRGRKGKKAPQAVEAMEPIPQLLPDLHLFRATIDAMTSAIASKIPDGTNIQADALSFRMQKGTEQLVLGSGTFEATRAPDAIRVSFGTSPAGRGTPLSLRLILPTTPGDIEVSASGGPVPLGLLGMHDGGFLHLLDVEKASFAGRGRVVLDAHGENLTFDVEGRARDLSLHEPRLAHDPIRGMDLGFSTRGLLNDKGELRLDDAEGSIGSAHLAIHGGLTQTPAYLAATFDFDFPTSSCQAVLTSIPTALIPTVSSARMDGTFGLHGHLGVDSRNLDAIDFNYDVTDHCRLVDVPADLERSRFSHGFSHVIYTKAGDREEETTGPGSEKWTELDQISPYMQVAVLTTEDGAFFHHHGFNHTAIRRAVGANLKAHRFVRGASTITMQLAKNLFLSREKTLARKLEELILADYLEQAFSKDEMMELYLNIIEFGPDIYGVTEAAEHYFGRRPNELNLAECMFLSSILPNPIAFHRAYDEGELGPGWLRTIRAHMSIAHQTGLISAAELAEGLLEPVTFHRPNTPPPTPRTPVSTPSHPAGATDWEELN